MEALTVMLDPPNPKQARFLSDRHRFVAYGGARGGGKSWAVRVKALYLCFFNPGITVMIIRRTNPELYANHIKPLLDLLPVGCYTYHETRKEMGFPGGSRILFRYCSCDKDLLVYQGTECDILFIDEATQFTEEQFRVLTACVRGANSHPKRVYLTCNPGGVGHQWVKRLFVDRRFEGSEKPEDYTFIQAGVRDNRVLMESQPEYLAQLEALPAHLRDAWLDGKWDLFSGQFFEEYRDDPEHYRDRRFSHVISPFPIPADWRIYRSFDWGYSRPYSCGWWAVDRDGVLYRILESYGCTGTPNQGVKWAPDRVFAELARIEREHPLLAGRHIIGVADPAIWSAESGESVADTAARFRIYFNKGDHARIPGWILHGFRYCLDSRNPNNYLHRLQYHLRFYC